MSSGKEKKNCMENMCTEVFIKRDKNMLFHSPVAKKLKNPKL